MTRLTDSITLLDDERGVRLVRDEDGNCEVQLGGFGAGAPRAYSLHLSAADCARLARWLQPPPDADPAPLPAWRLDPNGCWKRGEHASVWKPGTHWYASDIDRLFPSEWHAMAAADAALLAAGHRLTDPAPTPPDLRGVTFEAWEARAQCSRRQSPAPAVTLADFGMTIEWIPGCLDQYNTPNPRGRVLTFPHITTREQADAFLRACGATLEGGAAYPIEREHGKKVGTFSIQTEKAARAFVYEDHDGWRPYIRRHDGMVLSYGCHHDKTDAIEHLNLQLRNLP